MEQLVDRMHETDEGSEKNTEIARNLERRAAKIKDASGDLENKLNQYKTN